MKTLKSIGAVIAGLLLVIIVTTVVDVALHSVGFFPPVEKPISDPQALVATLYRLVISVAGAYLTARLAPDHPLRHAVILGCIGMILGLTGVIVTWNLGLGPRWYPIALTVLAIPQCWVGGKLYERKLASRVPTA